MAKSIGIDQLANEIADFVSAYNDDVIKGIEVEVDETAKKVRQGAQQEAPRDSGEYAKGFTITKQDDGTGMRRIIWNRKAGWKAHLLEYGHAKVDGGRVQAFPHMVPAYEKHGAQLPQRIKEIIQKGGRV